MMENEHKCWSCAGLRAAFKVQIEADPEHKTRTGKCQNDHDVTVSFHGGEFITTIGSPGGHLGPIGCRACAEMALTFERALGGGGGTPDPRDPRIRTLSDYCSNGHVVTRIRTWPHDSNPFTREMLLALKRDYRAMVEAGGNDVSARLRWLSAIDTLAPVLFDMAEKWLDSQENAGTEPFPKAFEKPENLDKFDGRQVDLLEQAWLQGTTAVRALVLYLHGEEFLRYGRTRGQEKGTGHG